VRRSDRARLAVARHVRRLQFDLGSARYITWKRRQAGKAEATVPRHERRSERARVLNRVFTLVDRQIALG